jgi:hypothetical protein
MSTQKSNTHFLQDYQMVTVHRSQIKEAEYNPRVMDDQSFKDLKRSMKKIKLREPLIWNKTSGNLVGGHQRIRVLDDEWKKKYKNLDYSLTVAVVELDKKQEIELNIALNNPRLQGTYSIEKMNEILSNEAFPDLDFEIAGIKDEDLQMFGIDADLGNLELEAVESTIEQFEQVKEQQKSTEDPEEHKAKTDEVKKIKSEVKKNEVDTYVTLSFSNQADKRAFMRKIGEQEDSLFIKGEIFAKKYFSE